MKKILFVALLCAVCALSSLAQGPPCTPTANLLLQVPNIGNTSNWGQCLNFDLGAIDTLLGGISYLPAGSATPSILSYNSNWITQNTTAVVITNFTGGYSGQSIKIFCGAGDTLTEILPGANFNMTTTWACSASRAITFTLIGNVWTEVDRQGGSAGSAGLQDPGASGVLKRTTYNTTVIAGSADIIGLWTGTCNNTTFLRADGSCQPGTGGGLGDPGSTASCFARH